MVDLSKQAEAMDHLHIIQDLTTSALASYVVGDRRKATEAMTADLAVIRL